MKYTPNYNLEKQQEEDYVNVNGINGNFDIIDKEIKEISDTANGKADATEVQMQNVIGTGKKIGDLSNGKYSVFEANKVFSDYPTNLSSSNYNFCTIEVNENPSAQYKTYQIIASIAGLNATRVLFGFKNGTGITWFEPASVGHIDMFTYCPNFVSPDTILDFAKTAKNNQIKFVLGPYFPSDLPVQVEGWIEVKKDATGGRYLCTFTPYQSPNSPYIRSALNGQWISVWEAVYPSSLPANGGNADTLDNKHASDFVGKTGTSDINGRITLNKVATTNNGWSDAGIVVQTISTTSYTEMPRIAFHSNGAGVCKQIAGDHVRGGVSVLNEDGTALTDFNCNQLKSANIKPSYVQSTAPSDTTSLWFY